MSGPSEEWRKRGERLELEGVLVFALSALIILLLVILLF